MSEHSTASKTPIPEHVPPGLVYDFDMFHDAEYVLDPHKKVEKLIKEAPPIFWSPYNGGHWILAGHKANFEAARDTESFSSEIIPNEQLLEIIASLPPDMERIPLSYPINLDPPKHAKYRQPLQKVFSPKSIQDLSTSIRELAGELIDKVAAKGGCEFMSSIAEPLPVQVFLRMLGLPLDKQDEYRKLVRDHLSHTDEMSQLLTMQNVAAAMRETILARKARPKDDIISLLWSVEIDGRPTTLDDIENYGVLLFVAGLDTVMQGMGHGMRHLAENPELQHRLRENPALIHEATEEMLRRYTFTVPPRRVARDVIFHGVNMKAGDKAMLFLPAANLDPEEFKDADKYQLDRDKKVHIAFNAGPHRCLGSHLARVELEILYEEWFKRIGDFWLNPDKPTIYHCGHVIGVDSLNLCW
ncbi:cytochrome P450 [Halioxenophilus sp. WMMB6]|uniref:cytochrome P450 n=1 Tax=Halioxenophilus sp. WMMB6 TaxID=3073815 RepID=UPI00295F44DB|nr:cytochrome P450 [Halioxenophilus sp. WMMB6]